MRPAVLIAWPAPGARTIAANCHAPKDGYPSLGTLTRHADGASRITESTLARKNVLISDVLEASSREGQDEQHIAPPLANAPRWRACIPSAFDLPSNFLRHGIRPLRNGGHIAPMNTLKYQIAAWAAFAAIVFVTVSPIEMRPGDIFSVDLDRALAFGLLSSMFMIAYPRHALLVGSFVVLSAGAIELLQALSPTRHARLDDATIKGAGALGGMLLAFSYNALRAIRHARRRARVAALGTPATLRLPVTSALIEAVYFSREDGKLRIRMRNGEEQIFGDVDESAVNSLVTAPSPGTYYLEHIRDKFPKRAA